MTTIIAFLGVWFIASAPFGIMAGRFIAAGQRDDLAEHLIVPRGDE